MRVLHTADWHLGHPADPQTVAGALGDLVTLAIAERPDIILVAGDIFHRPSPPATAVLAAFEHLQRLTRALPATPVTLIAGNHDLPRIAAAGSLLPLLTTFGCHVVERGAQWVDLPALDAALWCVPDDGRPWPGCAPPMPRRRTHQLAVVHAAIKGAWPDIPDSDHHIDPALLHAEEWDYVALGDYHVATDLGPNVGYSGAIAYTGSDIWSEARRERATLGTTGKVAVLYDTATRTRRHLPLPIRRRLYDLPPIDATGKDAAWIDAAIRTAMQDVADVATAAVRLPILGVHRDTRNALDYGAVRRYQARCGGGFRLILERPRRDPAAAHWAAAVRRASARDLLEEALSRRPLPDTMSRTALVAAGLQYYDATDDDASHTGALP